MSTYDKMFISEVAFDVLIKFQKDILYIIDGYLNEALSDRDIDEIEFDIFLKIQEKARKRLSRAFES